MNKIQRTITILVFDTLIIALSVIAAYLLRFDFTINESFVGTIPYVTGSLVLFTLCFLAYNKIYKSLWRYTSVSNVLSIAKSIMFAACAFFVLHNFVVHYFYVDLVVPRSIYLLYCMIASITLGGSRIFWKAIKDTHSRKSPHQLETMIVGAGDAGALVLKELKTEKSDFYPVCFVDDDPKKQGMEILGIPVAGHRMNIESIVQQRKIKIIILALPSASKSEIAEILEISKRTGCSIKILPRINDIFSGKISINMIRDVDVEDLLGREPVKVDFQEIKHYIIGQTVLVTGAGGSIGSELSRQIASFSPKKLLLLGHGENSIYDIELELRKKYPDLAIEPIIADIQDFDRIEHVFSTYSPKIVFHAAAHKHVPLMEKNPIEAIKNNVFGTKNVAECSHLYGVARFVMISTDKAVNPTNVMGATKRIAEMLIQSINAISETQFVAVRFGNVLGSRGSVVPVFKKQIQEGGPVTVTHPEMVRYFMTIPEAVQLVLQAGTQAEGGEIFVLDMGKPVKISTLATDLIRLSGLEPNKDIDIVYTGIRPGEKLFEEILTSEEGTGVTKHDRIFVGKITGVPAKESLDFHLRKFDKFFNKKDVNEEALLEIKRLLHQLVPTYKWNMESAGSARTQQEALQASLEIVASIERKFQKG
ncbi:polysaccharide biosynthesis protein [Gorillibacterium sp. sgz5001074]|uniref:polysaccharide biosynthesis protein n=1 Tax=Gorillibacterium sp. sgz5001074 TaxID=3446695 RepID=UPI003F66E8EC